MTQGNALAVATVSADVLEVVLGQGDLARLTAEQRVRYYVGVCDSVGLNPLTRPFEFMSFQGKTILYAKRDCTDQLRSTRNITVQIVGRERLDDVYVVTCRTTMPNGRSDESTGVVSLTGLRGESLANALMKAETKAKRRATLSIAGLGMLDETEAEILPGASVVAFDIRTGEMNGRSEPKQLARQSNGSPVPPVVETPLTPEGRVELEAVLLAGLLACRTQQAMRAYWSAEVLPKSPDLDEHAMTRLTEAGKRHAAALASPPVAPAAPPSGPAPADDDGDYPEPGSNG